MARWVTALLTMAMMATLMAATPSSQAPVPRLRPEKVVKPPRIDGKLDDAVWKTAPVTGPFWDYEDSQRQVNDTRARVAYDDQWLYIAVECDNPWEEAPGNRVPSRVFRKDIVSVYLTREGLGHHFVNFLTEFNAKTRWRVFVGKEGECDCDAGYDRFWRSATENGDKGWTAEIALPLDEVNGEKTGELRLNFLRDKSETGNARPGERGWRQVSFWSPVVHCAQEPDRFGVLEGLRGFRATSPFLPQIGEQKIGDLDITGAPRREVTIEVINDSPTGGKAKLEIVEGAPGDEKTRTEHELNMAPFQRETVTFWASTESFFPRQRTLTLTDMTTGITFARGTSTGPQLKLSFCVDYPEFSFYAKEKTFRVKAVMPLSKESLRVVSLTLRDAAGNVIAKTDKPDRETILSAGIDALKMGNNVLSLTLTRKDGQTLETVEVSVLRLPPGRGGESKIDYFNRAVLFNGAPFFPFGIYAEEAFSTDTADVAKITRQVADAGMNAVIGGAKAFSDWNPAETRAVVRQIAEQNNLLVGIWWGLKSNPKAAPRSESVIAALRDEPNLLFWQGFSDADAKDREGALKTYRAFREVVRKADPYHAVFRDYFIPWRPENELADIRGCHVYAYPNVDHLHTVLDQFAWSRASWREDRRLPFWVVLAGVTPPFRSLSRPLSGREQRCQSYFAIILGANGLLYRDYSATYGKDAWDALRTLGREIPAFSAALLNAAVEQTVTYASGDYDLSSWKCPPIPFRFFRYPDGRLMALAVNAKDYPVNATFEIEGLRGARRLFDGRSSFAVTEGRFSEKLEPLATRAYALDIVETSGHPLTARIIDIPHQEEAKILEPTNAIIFRTKKRKNLVFNPSLETRKVPALPDFYLPVGIKETATVGEKGSRWFLDAANPKFGAVSLRITQYGQKDFARSWNAGAWGAFVVPCGGLSGPYVFSFYARAEKDGDRVRVLLPRKNAAEPYREQTFALTTQWARYSMPAPEDIAESPARFSWYPESAGARVWLDGFQLESGTAPTAFSE